MADLERGVRLVAATLLLLLVACSGSSTDAPTVADGESVKPNDTAAATLTPTSAPAEVTLAPGILIPRSAPVEEGPAPADSEPTPRDGPTTVQLWFPNGDTTYSPTTPVDRLVSFDEGFAMSEVRIIAELLLAGPTEAEIVEGFAGFASRFSDCDRPFSIEATSTAAVVILCRQLDPDSSDMFAAALAHTIESLGVLGDVAILTSEGDRCAIGAEVDDPLACLSAEFRDRPGYRCPFGRPVSLALVTGVDEYADTYGGPSVDENTVGQISRGSMVAVYPSTLRYEGAQWWVKMPGGGRGQCVSIPAMFLTSTFGNLGDLVPGVSFELPPISEPNSWDFRDHARESAFDHTRWDLNDGFETSVSIELLTGKRIDDQLSLRSTLFDGLEISGEWNQPVEVDGADRAVSTFFVDPPNGGFHISELLLEVDDFTLIAAASVHTSVLDRVSAKAVETFLLSIRVDRETFIDSLNVSGTSQLTLHGFDYDIVPHVQTNVFTHLGACGPSFDLLVHGERGERTHAGVALSQQFTELNDRYLMWEVYCEGATPVSFAVARVRDDGRIHRIGSVRGKDVGVRADGGSHHVDTDGTITFEGIRYDGSDEIYVDTFTLDDLLAQF